MPLPIDSIVGSIRKIAELETATAEITVVNAEAGSYTATNNNGSTMYLRSATVLTVGQVVKYRVSDLTVIDVIADLANITVDI